VVEDSVLVASVELVSLAALVVSLSSSPQATRTSGMTMANNARSLRGTMNLLRNLPSPLDTGELAAGIGARQSCRVRDPYNLT